MILLNKIYAMKTIAIFLTCFLYTSAISQTIMDETFPYGTAAGPLCGSIGVTTNWTPHLNAGTTTINYTASSLVYTGYGPGAATGNGAVTFANGLTTRESVNRILPLVNSGSVYVSFLLKISGATSSTLLSDYVVHFNDTFGTTLTSNFIGRIFIKNQIILPYSNIGISKGSPGSSAVFSTVNYTVNSTVLVVMKYVFNNSSSTDDNVYTWIFTSGVPITEPAPQLTATDMTVNDLAQIRSVCIRQGTDGTSYGTIDGIKVGLTWQSTLLPVTWLDFTAKLNEENSVLLKWQTASENNNSHFEVERKLDNPDDNERWETLGKVKGNGTANAISNYNLIDDVRLSLSNSNSINSRISNTIYYRLKQVDFDGNFQYSDIVKVNLNNETDIRIFPNPANNILSITGTAKVNINIYDMQCRLIASKIQANNIDVSELVSGLYLITLDNGGTQKSFRFVKE